MPATRRTLPLDPDRGSSGRTEGDAITGQSAQPGAPFTATIGLQYKFTVFDRESFIRVDDEYEGRGQMAVPRTRSNTQQYDSANYVLIPDQLQPPRARA